MEDMKRVMILGRGGSGKSTLAAHLGTITGLPVIELDKHFWRPGLEATPPDQWAAAQRQLVRDDAWIMDGDLGPYDVPEVRLRAADTVILLDFSFWRCAWRAIRRSRKRADFWHWVWAYRRRSRPFLLAAIATYAGDANLHVIRNPRTLRRFLTQVTTGQTPGRP
jgi:adenylate kinase family enzyme